MDSLEQWLKRTASEDDVSLDRLQDDVWARVRTIQAHRMTGRMRVAAVACALVVGVANGGVGATLSRTPSSEMAVFSSDALSPLARLESH